MCAGISGGFPGFIAHNEFHTGEAQYLKDDTLYFRVSVEVTGLKTHEPLDLLTRLQLVCNTKYNRKLPFQSFDFFSTHVHI